MEIYTNPNKFIAKLPTKIDLLENTKKCHLYNALNFDHFIKVRLIDAVYSNFSPDVLIQTFLYLFNVIGQGVYVHIKKNELKEFNIFSNKISVNQKLIKNIKKFLLDSIKKFEGEVIFFINLSEKPALLKKGYDPNLYFKNQMKISLKQHNYPFHYPILSFSSGYKCFDFSLPLFDNKITFKVKEGLIFLFEKSRLDYGITNEIYNKILEFKKHPFYKDKKLDFILCNNYFDGNQEIGEVNIVIKDPCNPIFLEQLIVNNKDVIIIDPSDFFAWYEEFNSLTVWRYSNWVNELDSFEKKKVKPFKMKVDKKEYFLSFLDNLTENFRQSQIYITPYQTEADKFKKMDYNKYFNILTKNYKLFHCWSYRLNPYYLLIDFLKTNHFFVPSFIKLCSLNFSTINNLIWITNEKHYHLEFLQKILVKNKIKNIYHECLDYLKGETKKFLGETCYYIEFPHPSTNLKEWETEHLDNLDLIKVFMDNLAPGSIIIIRLYTFRLPRTKEWIQLFQKKFETIKIIKNEWFDIFMPYRYLVGINYRGKPSNLILDLDLIEKEFYDKEVTNIEIIFKYVHSKAKVENSKMNNKEEIKEWLQKYIVAN